MLGLYQFCIIPWLTHEAGIPNLNEVQDLAGDISEIAPLRNQTEAIVAWKIKFNKNNLSGEGIVKTRGDLRTLSSNLGNAEYVCTELVSNGCVGLTVNPFTMVVSAKIANSSVTGNASSKSFILSGPQKFVSNDHRNETVWKMNGIIGWNSMYYSSDAKDLVVEIKEAPELNGAWCSVKYYTYSGSIWAISKSNVEDLNRFLLEHYIMLTF
jgi:hypothetical protein